MCDCPFYLRNLERDIRNGPFYLTNLKRDMRNCPFYLGNLKRDNCNDPFYFCSLEREKRVCPFLNRVRAVRFSSSSTLPRLYSTDFTCRKIHRLRILTPMAIQPRRS